jgi:hypothetical protein
MSGHTDNVCRNIKQPQGNHPPWKWQGINSLLNSYLQYHQNSKGCFYINTKIKPMSEGINHQREQALTRVCGIVW